MGTSVTISGTGFTGAATINHSSGVTFNGTNVSIGSTQQDIASNGTWSATFTVPNSPQAPRRVKATDSASVSATNSFTVQAAITLSVTSGPAGTSVTIYWHRLHQCRDDQSQLWRHLQRDEREHRQHATVSRLERHLDGHIHGANSSSGAKTVKATDSSGVSASTSFTVTR